MNTLSLHSFENFTGKPLVQFGNWIKGLHFLDVLNQTKLYTTQKRDFLELDAEMQSRNQIFDTTTLLSVTDLEGNITFANENFCRISKYTIEELIGRPQKNLFHKDMPINFYQDIFKTTGKGKVWHGELKYQAADGSSYWVKATVAPVLGEDKRPIKYICVCIDITHQKELELQLQETKRQINIELMQNIQFARQMHTAFLTPVEQIKKIFPESFLIYRAQNMISGDFYRVEKKNDKSIILFGDSTGHGVSASYTSHHALNIFNHSVNEGCSNPARILRKMNKEIHEILHSGSDCTFNQSADTMVCSIDEKSRLLKYSSANIKGVLLRDGEITELKRHKISIGYSNENSSQIMNDEIQLQNNDCIYLFSDGIHDQFGGPSNKKFSYRSVLDMLKDNHKLSMNEQNQKLNEILYTWQGNNEQTDDMSMIGIKISA